MFSHLSSCVQLCFYIKDWIGLGLTLLYSCSTVSFLIDYNDKELLFTYSAVGLLVDLCVPVWQLPPLKVVSTYDWCQSSGMLLIATTNFGNTARRRISRWSCFSLLAPHKKRLSTQHYGHGSYVIGMHVHL